MSECPTCWEVEEGPCPDCHRNHTQKVPVWGGDLFNGSCEDGHHAWRVDWDVEGHPVACKWCDKPRYKDDDMNDFEKDEQ